MSLVWHPQKWSLLIIPHAFPQQHLTVKWCELTRAGWELSAACFEDAAAATHSLSQGAESCRCWSQTTRTGLHCSGSTLCTNIWEQNKGAYLDKICWKSLRFNSSGENTTRSTVVDWTIMLSAVHWWYCKQNLKSFFWCKFIHLRAK